MRNRRKISLQKLFPILSQLLDKVQGIEDGQEHIPLSKEIGQIQLPDLIAIIGDGHAVFPAGAIELVERACFVHKAHPNGDIGVILIVQAINPTFPKEGTAGNGKGDGVCNAAFPSPVSACDDRGVAEHQLCRLLIGLEARKHQAGDLKLLDLFQRIAPFLFFAESLFTPPCPLAGRSRRIPARKMPRYPADAW